jgi:type II secretory pathway pseudopilin PulG
MGIFGLLVALVIANFSKGTETNKFKEASLRLVQSIRIAQNYALSGKSLWRCADDKSIQCIQDAECGGADPSCENRVPTGGFGLNITGNIYNVFADQYQNSLSAPSRTFNGADGSAIIVENMSNGLASIIAYKLSGQSSQQSLPSTIDITFEPPTGTIHFCINKANCATTENPEATDSTISFLIAKNNDLTHNCRQVTINRISGQIGEQGNPNCVL